MKNFLLSCLLLVILIACESKSGKLTREKNLPKEEVIHPELIVNDSIKIVVERIESDNDIRYMLLLNNNKIFLDNHGSYIWSYHSSHNDLDNLIEYMFWLYESRELLETKAFVW